MDYKIESKDKYIHIRFKEGSILSVDDLIQVLDDERKNPALNGKNDIWDMRGCSPDANYNINTLQKLIRHIQQGIDPNALPVKTALIVDSPLAYGLSRMFQNLADELSYEIRVYKSEELESAIDWIKEN